VIKTTRRERVIPGTGSACPQMLRRTVRELNGRPLPRTLTCRQRRQFLALVPEELAGLALEVELADNPTCHGIARQCLHGFHTWCGARRWR
jgi:hypothetical protein